MIPVPPAPLVGYTMFFDYELGKWVFVKKE
jgi:hypothetical protein